MEDKNISWVAWCFHPVWQPAMVKNWDFELTGEESLVKQALVPDNTLPTVSIDILSAGSTVEGNVTIAGTASDNVRLLLVEVKIGDGPYQPAIDVFDSSYRWDNWSYSWDTLTVPNGNYTLTARAMDVSGNTFTCSITVELANSID